MKHDLRLYLQDILDSIEAIESSLAVENDASSATTESIRRALHPDIQQALAGRGRTGG